MTKCRDYKLYYKFIETYCPRSFVGIDRSDSLIIELEKMTEANNQYFFVGDLLQGKIIFTSKRSTQMVGVDPEELNPYHNMEAVHPDEVYRNTSGWAKLLNMANELLRNKGGAAILSVNMKLRNPDGRYPEILFQSYLFYCGISSKTVYVLMVLTDIDEIPKKKTGYHYYSGKDLSFFRYPDEKMLMIGNDFSKREIEIIQLAEKGLSTEQIAEKLFLSPYTVNTHRANILKKSGKTHISDHFSEFRERGLI
jgi:DNA-binding CsgD family transcriptional regulator